MSEASLFQSADVATSGKDEWLTPPYILQALGHFDLDPCHPVAPPWKIAERFFTCHDNGLMRPWSGYVWCNPPYSTASKWLGRCAEHGNAMALTFARTETEMFFRHVWERADAVRFLRGRLQFCNIFGQLGGAAPAPSVIIAYGGHALRKLESAEVLGGKFIKL